MDTKQEYDKQEILKALHVLRGTCRKQYPECSYCPFGDSGGHCIITEQYPQAWDIVKEEGIWRAFE